MDPEELNKCLRSELSAIDTYRQALEKNRSAYGTDAKFQQLSQMLTDHEEAASRVRALIVQMGGTPSQDSGAWGTWSQTVMGAAKLFGDKPALKALKEGEESGVKQYQRVLQDGNTPADVKNVLTTIVTREQEHLRQLDLLMQTT